MNNDETMQMTARDGSAIPDISSWLHCQAEHHSDVNDLTGIRGGMQNDPSTSIMHYLYPCAEFLCRFCYTCCNVGDISLVYAVPVALNMLFMKTKKRKGNISLLTFRLAAMRHVRQTSSQ